jgi:hypothetical protein
MPAGSKSKTTISRPAFDVKVLDWAKRLWSAVSKPSHYSEVHEDFIKEFKKIRDEGKALNVTQVTMVDHVAPIYSHVALHGYNAHIHYLPLKLAVSNFCESKPVADWKPPPDESNQSSSSPSPSPSPRPPHKSNPKRRAKQSQTS